MDKFRHIAVCLCLSIWVSLSFGFLPSYVYAADEPEIVKAEEVAAAARADLDQINSQLNVGMLSEDKNNAVKARIVTLRKQVNDILLSLNGPLKKLQSQLDKLGPPPAEGPETEALAEQRAQLIGSLGRVTAVKKQLEFVQLDISQAISRAAESQRERFLKQILMPGKSILNPVLWIDGAQGASEFFSRFSRLMSFWWKGLDLEHFVKRGLSFVFSCILLFLAHYFAKRRWRLRSMWQGASYSISNVERLWRGVFVILVVGAVFLIVEGLWSTFALDESFSAQFVELYSYYADDNIANGLVACFLIYRVASPSLPQWRLLNIDDHSAKRFSFFASLAVVVVHVAQVTEEIATGFFYLPFAYLNAFSALAAGATVFLLSYSVIILSRAQPALQSSQFREEAHDYYFGWTKRYKPLIWLLLFIATAALLFGFIKLARFISEKILFSSLLLGLLFLMHHLVNEAMEASLDGQSRFGRFIRKISGIGEIGIGRLAVFAQTSVDILLVLIGVPLLFSLWFTDWIDFRDIYFSTATGIKLGDVELSPRTILLVIAVFSVGVILTRLITRWLDWRILSASHIEKGAQESIRKGLSWAGYLVALAFAFAAGGINFSNIAIIAGALGVGIGLGLQTIVNNFVSGLMLLVERPIRLGDWIVIPAANVEGLVKQISVRSTLVETFDHAVIIVPNAMLISGVVKNWTLRGTAGRFKVEIMIVHGSNLRKAMEIFTRVVAAQKKILSDPPPVITLDKVNNFGMEFTVNAMVINIHEGIKIASELRLQLIEELNKEGISLANTATNYVALKSSRATSSRRVKPKKKTRDD